MSNPNEQHPRKLSRAKKDARGRVLWAKAQTAQAWKLWQRRLEEQREAEETLAKLLGEGPGEA